MTKLFGKPYTKRICFEAGFEPNFTLQPGHVAYVTTGAALPAGCEAVVRIEDTEAVEREGARPGPRPRARTINHAMIGAAWTATKTSRTSQVPTVFK